MFQESIDEVLLISRNLRRLSYYLYPLQLTLDWKENRESLLHQRHLVGQVGHKGMYEEETKGGE